MAEVISVEVVGIKALTNDLLRMSNQYSGQLLPYLQAAGEQAMEPIAEAVRGTLPRITGRLIGSVRVNRTRTGAAVREGNEEVVYAGPVDFGGYPGSRPFYPNGRYLFPAAQHLSAVAESVYTQAVNKALDHIKWTNETSDAKAV